MVQSIAVLIQIAAPEFNPHIMGTRLIKEMYLPTSTKCIPNSHSLSRMTANRPIPMR